MTPLDSAKSTHSVSESCESTGQLSLFGETCERSRVLTSEGLFTTPCGRDANAQYVKFKQGGTPLTAQLTSSPPAIPASHSQSPGSDWARKMTATYGRKLGDWYLSSGPVDACLRMLLGTSIWGSTTCYLTWKSSATPQGRLLFRLVPSTHRTGGTGSGFWGTPQERSHKDTPGAKVPTNGYLARQVYEDARMWPTPQGWDGRRGADENRDNRPNSGGTDLTTATASNGMKLNSVWVSRMMGYPDGWMDVGEETR
jgi:hypothetical protein